MLGVKGTKHKIGVFDLLARPFGQTTAIDLIRGVQHVAIKIRLRADITIASGAASGTVRNRGRLSALLDRVKLSEHGDRTSDIDAKALQVISQGVMSPKEVTQVTALASGDAQANTILEELVTMRFALPLIGSPHETNYIEDRPDLDFRLELQTVANAYTALVSGGDRTFTVNSFTAEVVQLVDARTSILPFFLPTYNLIADRVITGTMIDHEVKLDPKGHIALLLLQTTAGVGYEVADVIDSIELRSANTRLIDGKVTPDFLRQEFEDQFGGVIPPGYIPINFLTHGRLGGVYNPVLDPDLRIRGDFSASAVAGGQTLRVWALQLNQSANWTRALPDALVG